MITPEAVFKMLLEIALARWLSWMEHSPIHQKVMGLIPSRVCMGGNQTMLPSHISVSLSTFLSI